MFSPSFSFKQANDQYFIYRNAIIRLAAHKKNDCFLSPQDMTVIIFAIFDLVSLIFAAYITTIILVTSCLNTRWINRVSSINLKKHCLKETAKNVQTNSRSFL